MIRLDAGVGNESMEVVCRFPGGLDFGRGLVDVNVSGFVVLMLIVLNSSIDYVSSFLLVHDVAPLPMSQY